MQISSTHHAFSETAHEYDEEFSNRLHVVQLRKRVHELIRQYFPSSGVVLELGCGTGEDALFLQSFHYDVIASDVSSEMLRIARQKSLNKNSPIQFIRFPADHLHAIKERSCDAILSNFGGLNCVEDISHLLHECFYVLKDNGVMIVCLMNRYLLWETFSYIVRGRFRHAFRRWTRSGVYVPVGKYQVLTWYHSVRTIKRAIKNKFTITKIIGLNIISPPPGSMAFRSKFPRLTKFLETIERKIEALPLVSLLGDHYVLVLERFE